MLAAGPNWSGPQLAGNWDVIWYYALQHIRYTIVALVLGGAVALPLAYLGYRRPRTYPVLLGATNVVYAVPSVAMFFLLSPVFGITNDKPVVIAMALYSLVILVRGLVEGLRAVPPSTVAAATGLGYRPVRRFVGVELPLAVPNIVAALRLASVSTISLISVGGLVGHGALGRLFTDGAARTIPVEIWSGVVAVLVIALLADALILLAGRLLTPWARAGAVVGAR